ncbi:hypothetical protein AQI95_24900 [Streptomyces yokosukanensis]|uniref:Uncharacterized protein n=1 Tax=Streptomyces yokosukanensis TaxID=67386 RepID=A0A101P0P9_9ACTN|nr:hypothetical protein [Streptomyces yokosukanensis]KUN02782.1 hypothetical protein AQI95_24900 [Streptomyces yokosukanensis]
MSISPLVLKATQVIEQQWLHGPAYDLATQAAVALESAQLLQSPELVTEVAEAAVLAAETAVKELRRAGEEIGRLRARIALLEAERHTTNAVLADVTLALREAQDVPAREGLAAWLYREFVPHANAASWERLSSADRAYWEQRAVIVQRAFASGSAP